MEKGYMYMWEYHVKENMILEFEKAYGADGDWVKFFNKADGYIKTELHKDINNKSRYITIDYWASKEACETYKEKFKSEFVKIDKACEEFTLKEIPHGSFQKIFNE